MPFTFPDSALVSLRELSVYVFNGADSNLSQSMDLWYKPDQSEATEVVLGKSYDLARPKRVV